MPELSHTPNGGVLSTKFPNDLALNMRLRASRPWQCGRAIRHRSAVIWRKSAVFAWRIAASPTAIPN